VNRATFMRILQQPSGITHAMRLMNQTSVLGRYLWPFRRIVGQMQHDLFHVYTVDQHILMVLRNMRRFFMAEHAHEYPFCSQLASGLGQALDAVRGRAVPRHRQGPRRRPLADRRDGGAALCRQHGVDARGRQLIEFLVREHLTMSRWRKSRTCRTPT
jgi:[protein-PII] uridylyltransferase